MQAGRLDPGETQFTPLSLAQVREVDQPNQRMVGLAVYTNPNSAAYARKKLHGFEYPPGSSKTCFLVGLSKEWMQC